MADRKVKVVSGRHFNIVHLMFLVIFIYMIIAVAKYVSKEEMELIYQKYGLEITDHFAQDGLTPLLAQKVDKWNESQFKIWCDYHYSVCREQSVLGASNHVVVIGKK